MNPEQFILAFEKDIAEIMRQLKERVEAPLPEKIEKLDESIRTIKDICAKYGQTLKRMREVESRCRTNKRRGVRKFR